MTLGRIIEYASQNGFEGVEIVNRKDLWRKDIADDIKLSVARFRERKLRYYCYSVCEDLAAPDKALRWRAINKVREAILLASVTTAPVVCVHGCGKSVPATPWDQTIAALAEALNDCLDLAEKKRVTLAVVNGGHLLNGTARLTELLNKVRSERMALTLDVAAMLLVEEEPADAIRELASSIVNVYITDARSSETYLGNEWTTVRGRQLTPCAVGEGIVPQREVLYTLKRLEYAGYVTVLYQGDEEPAVGIERSTNYLKTMFREVRSL